MNKDEALQKFPAEVAALNEGKDVQDSETLAELQSRVKKAIQIILQSGKNSAIIVSHGMFLKSFSQTYLQREILKTH